jgi:DNA-binding Xre family transcriptional regulator
MFLTKHSLISCIFIIFAAKELKIIMAKLNRIKVVLAERDLNNKWLADKIGKDPATVSKWITNTTQPSLQMLLDIAAALEVSVQELVRQKGFNQ